MLRRLLVRERDADQRRLAPGAAEDRHPDRQPQIRAAGHREIRIARDRRQRGAPAHAVVAVDQVDQRRGPARRRDEGVEPMLVHRLVDALLAGQTPVLRECVLVLLLGERTLGLRLLEDLLGEVGHLSRAVLLVEPDQVLERPVTEARRERREVRGQAGLELVEQDLELAVVELADRRDVGGVHDHGAELLQLDERLLDEPVGRGRLPVELLAGHADPESLDALAERLRVVDRGAARSRRALRRRVGGVRPGNRGQQDRRVGHRAAHRAGGVLRVRDRDDARAADEADRGLDADESAVVGRRDDRAVGLGPHRHGAQARRRGGPGAGARARGVAVERVGIPGLAAAATPAARGVRRAEIRPLREIGLAEEDRPGVAQALDHVCIGGRTRIDQGERSRGRLHAVRGADVVLHEHRNAVQRASHLARLALGVQSLRDRCRVGVDLDHGAQRGALAIDRVDAGQVLVDERARGVLAGLHALLQLRDGRLLELEGRDGRGGGLGNGFGSGESRSRESGGAAQGSVADQRSAVQTPDAGHGASCRVGFGAQEYHRG